MEDFTKEQKEYIKQLMKDTVKSQLDSTLKEQLGALFTDVTNYVDERVPQPVIGEEPKPEESTAVSARLQELERQLQSEKDARNVEIQERTRLTLTNQLRDELTNQGISAKSATELLTGRLFPNMTMQDGSFISKEGKNLKEIVTDFVATDGVDFRPKVSGVGTENGTTPSTESKPSLDSNISSFLTW